MHLILGKRLSACTEGRLSLTQTAHFMPPGAGKGVIDSRLVRPVGRVERTGLTSVDSTAVSGVEAKR